MTDEPEIIGNPEDIEPDLEVTPDPEPEPEPEPIAPEPVKPNLREIPDDEFLAEAHRRAAYYPQPQVQPQAPPEDPRLEEARRLRQDYKDDEADKLLLQIATENAVKESQRQFSERYELTRQIEAKLATFTGVTPEWKANLMAQAATLDVDSLKIAIAQGNVEREAKSHLYDLMQQGKISTQPPPPPIRTAPTDTSPADPGLRGKLSAENLAILKAQEKEFGFTYTDQMIKDSGLL